MPLVDSNVWLALALSKHKFHSAAKSWLAKQSAREPALFCRLTQLSFLRLLTTEAILAPYATHAMRNKAAWSLYESFLSDERIDFVDEPRALESSWKTLAATRHVSPKLWTDAYLAAFAIAGKYQFVTTDKGFKQFKGLELLVLSNA